MPESRFFDSDGVRIHYVDSGPRHADPVVLVHGFSQHIDGAWGTTGAIRTLSGRFRVIALDCRGHGRSDKPHDPDAYGANLALDVVRLLDHLELDRAHVVGYSMGGRIVFRLMADHPHRLLSAMPCGISTAPPAPEFAGVLEGLIASLESGGGVRPILEYFASPDSMTEQEITQAAARADGSNDRRALLALLRASPDLRADPDRLAANEVPCLAIIGEHDRLRERLGEGEAAVGSMETEVLEGADHLNTLGRAAFLAGVQGFLERQAVRSP